MGNGEIRESIEKGTIYIKSLPATNIKKEQLGIEFGSVVWETTDVTSAHGAEEIIC
jgi:hypothetical protein